MGILALELFIAAALACGLAAGLYLESFSTGSDPLLMLQVPVSGLAWLAPCLAAVWILSWGVRRLRRAAGLDAERIDGARSLLPLTAGLLAIVQPVTTFFPLGFPLLLVSLFWIVARTICAALRSDRGGEWINDVEAAFARRGAVMTSLLAAGLLFLFHLTIISGVWSPLPQPEGDEPHYLIISWSMLTDGELQLADDYKAREYHRWHEGWIQAHTKAGKGGMVEQYSMHNIGLAVWQIPFLWLGLQMGSSAAIVFLARLGVVLLAAVFFFLLCQLAIRLSGRHVRSLLLTLLTGATVPYLFFSWHLFTELPAALVTLAAFGILWRDQSPGPLPRIILGLCIATLPWLGVKYFALVLMFCIFWIAQEWRWGLRVRTVWVAVPGAALGLLFFLSTWQLFGTVSPSAYYLGAEGNVLERNIVFKVTGAANPLEAAAIPAKTVLAYFIDQREGILFYAPWFLMGMLALWLLRREGAQERRLVLWLVLLTVPFILLYSLTGFGGGHSPPARALAPVSWILVVAIACLPAERLRVWRGLAVTTCSISVLIALALLIRPEFLYHDFSVPASHLLSWLSTPFADATRLFPSINNKFFEDWGVTALWCPIIALIVFLALRRRQFTPSCASASGLLLILAALVSWALIARMPPLSGIPFNIAGGAIHFQQGNVFNDGRAFWVKTATRETCFLIGDNSDQPLPVRLRAVAPTVVMIGIEGQAERIPLTDRRVATARIAPRGGFRIGTASLRRFSIASLGGNPAGLEVTPGETRPLGVEVIPRPGER